MKVSVFASKVKAVAALGGLCYTPWSAPDCTPARPPRPGSDGSRPPLESPVLQIQSDDALVLQAQQDLAAFGALYEKYSQRVFAYVYRRIGSIPDAEDITERVFLQAMGHLRQYHLRGAPFSAWLMRIAHNLVANHYRDTSRHPEVNLEAGAALTTSDEPTFDLLEELAAIRRALTNLPAERQRLIVLKFVEELPNAEIGRIMGRSEGAIKSLVHRTIESLRGALADFTNSNT